MRLKNFSIYDIALVSVFVAVISVCSFITVPFAVPFTMQLFGVFLSVGLLGMKRGTVCIVAYILLGLTGAPVFSSLQGGVQVLMGQTGGFLVGFVFAALVSGFIIDKWGRKFKTVLLSMLCGLLICYICGALWLFAAFNFDFKSVIILTLPLLVFDVLKVTLAAYLSLKLKKFVRYLK